MKNPVALNADVTTAIVTSDQKTAGYYAPVFRIRIKSEGLAVNATRGFALFRVLCFNNSETFYKDFSIQVSDNLTSDCTLLDLTYREQTISAFAHNDGTFVTVYVKTTAIAGSPVWVQYLFAPNKAFIEDMPMRFCTVDKAAIVTGTKIDAKVYNAPSLSWTGGWSNNIDATYTTKLTQIVIDFDRVSLAAAITGGTTTDGTKIGAVVPLPQQKPTKFIGHTVAVDGTIGHCTITIETNGDLKIYGATTNNLVMFDFSYSIYY